MLYLCSDLWRTLIKKEKKIHSGHTQNNCLNFLLCQMQVGHKHTFMGSSLHANDPFLIYTNYACFQLQTWLDRLDHIFLQTSQKSNTNWSHEGISGSTNHTAVLLLATRNTSHFETMLELTAVHKNMLSFSNEITILMNSTQNPKNL